MRRTHLYRLLLLLWALVGAKFVSAQTFGLVPAPAGSSPPNPVESQEDALVAQQCIVKQNAYFVLNTQGTTYILSNITAANATVNNCCSACHDNTSCDAWQWCTLHSSCGAGNTTFAAGTCLLLSVPGFSAYEPDDIHMETTDSDSGLIAGAPFIITSREVPGYTLAIGFDFGSSHDFDCANTIVPGACALRGGLEDVAAACGFTSACTGFAYYPRGMDYTSWAMGILKAVPQRADLQEEALGTAHSSGGSAGASSDASGAVSTLEATSSGRGVPPDLAALAPWRGHAAATPPASTEVVVADAAAPASFTASDFLGSMGRGAAPVTGSTRDLLHEFARLQAPPAAEAWHLAPEEVTICRRGDGTFLQIGAGAFGTVFKGVYRDRHVVAVKVLHRAADERRSREFVHEVTLLKSLSHRHVVQFLGACTSGPMAMLVTEFMELGDLWRAMPLTDAQGQRIFSWRCRGAGVALDVAQGLDYLHAQKVVHLDLKSANILLSRLGTAKIADVGFARVLQKSYLSVLSGLGTLAWSAPEVLAGRRCTEKADIYSYGVLLWEIVTGEGPVRGRMRSPRTPEECPVEVAALIATCCAEDPCARPTAPQLVQLLSAMQG
ncbi:Putative serine/threonine-protein kinase/receptor R831 [Auxenochlorella protothecoides]|uniref:Putative serine/threonine-protein kinase/receptor R831 n=1 Tax=Auxenochlorella protothecoides TaxID=3075 RepID=A0A087SE35_AUXPR|nr:Putative serine/threonine-protein kinase/receptor R831 [Auxenochlorella protothecoides]KFM23989.1 Putative serine/threonine-protein kinase/receptor R831 [Auxenochlorella protothecoides]